MKLASAQEYAKMIREYLKSRQGAWAETTLKNAESQLKTLPRELALSNDGARIYNYLKDDRKLKPYSLKIVMTRISDFLDWAIESGHVERSFNNVRLYMKHNKRLFKGVYDRKPPKFDFQEVKEKIKQIKDEDSRKKALQLLKTGLRWSESFTLKDGQVVGKGNVVRNVVAVKDNPHLEKVEYSKTYATFVNHLKKVGLKPHDLRKAHAILIAQAGAHPGELMRMMGWTSMETAASYTQHVRDQYFIKQLKKVMEDDEDGK